MARIHHYEGEKIIVEFELGRCIHTGDCTRDLPEVFNVKRVGRWVHPDAAPIEDVARICAACPTGALRCVDKSSGKTMHHVPVENSIQCIADGPLYVHAQLTVNGKTQPMHRVALCRCGASALMPFCDNSHKVIDFRDAGQVGCPLPGEASAAAVLTVSSTPDGPLMIEGPFTLLDAAGKAVCKSSKAALCRCGASKMKPYCDGSHNQIDFKAD